jgi:GH24 family phage-related lysozyme (muramidase)|tara:strand:- start:2869 stop:3687 length:819 start_codon:yes stop_codon:yes gene_type:complete
MTFDQLTEANEIILQEGPFTNALAALGIIGATLGGAGQVQARMPTPITQAIKQDQSYYEYIAPSEGKGKDGRPGYAYKDHKGYLTVGVGHLVLKNDRALQQVAGKHYSNVVRGRTPLTDKQMEQLFNIDVKQKISAARRALPAFDSYPQYLRNAIVDGFFRGDLSGSKDTLALMNKGDFKAAAKEYLNHAGYRKSKEEGTGVAGRMERNAAVFATFGGDIPQQPVKTDFYVVKPGDTLSKISKLTGKSIEDLMRSNNINNPNKINVGQRLSI